MVLKPSEVAPFSGQIFAEILHAAGVPTGVFNLVHGDGPMVGALTMPVFKGDLNRARSGRWARQGDRVGGSLRAEAHPSVGAITEGLRARGAAAAEARVLHAACRSPGPRADL